MTRSTVLLGTEGGHPVAEQALEALSDAEAENLIDVTLDRFSDAGAVALHAETDSTPTATVVPAVGAVSVSAEIVKVDIEAQGPGQAVMDEIRAAYREGVISTVGGAPPGPKTAARHGGRLEQMEATVSRWQALQESDDTIAKEVARRFSTTWVRLADARVDSGWLTNDQAVLSGLDAFYADARYAIVDLGLRTAGITNALCNSRAELDLAFAVAKASPHISETEVRFLAGSYPRNVVAVVEQAAKNADAVVTAMQSGQIPRIEEWVVRKLAVRQPDEVASVNRARRYSTDLAELKALYADNPLVAPSWIHHICSSSDDPAGAIRTKLALIAELIPLYKGKGGLTEFHIAERVFKERKPTIKLDRCIYDAESVRHAIGDNLSVEVVRELILNNADPVKAGKTLVKKVGALRQELADDSYVRQVFNDSDYGHFQYNYGKSAARRARDFARNVVDGRDYFKDERIVNEALLRAASREEGADVIRSVHALLDQMRAFYKANTPRNVPWSVVQKAVTESANPASYIDRYVETRQTAKAVFGDRIRDGVISHLSRMSPVGAPDRMRRTLAAIDQTVTELGAFAELDQEQLITNAFRLADPIEGIFCYVAEKVLRNMQQRNADKDNHYLKFGIEEVAIAQLAEEWLVGHLPEGKSPIGVSRRFGQLCARYQRDPATPNLMEYPGLLRRICMEYAARVVAFEQAGIEQPEVAAQYRTRIR
jgi:hypothetical protein